MNLPRTAGCSHAVARATRSLETRLNMVAKVARSTRFRFYHVDDVAIRAIENI